MQAEQTRPNHFSLASTHVPLILAGALLVCVCVLVSCCTMYYVGFVSDAPIGQWMTVLGD